MRHGCMYASVTHLFLIQQVGGSAGVFGLGAKASATFGKASSVGKTTVNTSAESSGKDTRELEARYQQYIRVRFNLAIIKARRKLRSGESNEEHSAS